MATVPVPVFIDHHASGPSGITTYADHLTAEWPGLVRINLHADGADDEAPVRLNVPASRSHDPVHVAASLIETVRARPGARVVWLPNVGDVSWAATWHALTRLTADERRRVRVFGIVHGDQESQYDAMCRYACLLAGVAGVSARCVARLDAVMPADAPRPMALQYPVRLPAVTSAVDEAGPLRIVYAGRFEESQKRVSRLPALFQHLADHGVPFVATLAGDGPDRVALESALAALSLPPSSAVRLAGSVSPDRMPALLAAHDVLVLVSAFEGTPLVVLEAMATGLCPVMMELSGGLPELLRDGENAWLVAQGDIAGMAGAIATLHADRARLAHLKAAARATLARRADPASHVAWLREQLAALWERPAPDPDLVRDPDPLGRRIDRLTQAVRAALPGSVAIAGAGVVGRQIADRLLDAGVIPMLMTDMDPVRRGAYRGIPIDAPQAIDHRAPAIVAIGSVAFADEMIAVFRQRVPQARVFAP